MTVAAPILAWGVGEYSENEAGPPLYGSLIEKWTGGTTWSVVGTGGANAALNAVTSFGVSRAVAVGSIGVDPTELHALVTVWNGSTWDRTVLPLVAKSTRNELVAVSGSSANDVWAVGDYTIGKEARVLLEHFNGAVWSRSAIPGGQQPLAAASAVLDLAASDVWVAGSGDQTGSLLWHYNGSTWTEEQSPPFMYGAGPGLVGTADSDLNTLGFNAGDTVEHYNGAEWSQVGPTANANAIQDALAEGASGSRSLWTVGTFVVGGTEEGRIYIAMNGIEVPTPNVAGILQDIGTGFGLAFAVGVPLDTDTLQPIVMASCD